MPTRSERPAKERSSYRLPSCLARSGFGAFALSFGAPRRWRTWNLAQSPRDSGFEAFASPRNDGRSRLGQRRGASGPRELADGPEFHGAVGNHDPEGGAQGALDQMDVAAMEADQFGRDGQAEPTAAGSAGGLERLEQMVAGLGGHAGPGVGNFQDR